MYTNPTHGWYMYFQAKLPNHWSEVAELRVVMLWFLDLSGGKPSLPYGPEALTMMSWWKVPKESWNMARLAATVWWGHRSNANDCRMVCLLIVGPNFTTTFVGLNGAWVIKMHNFCFKPGKSCPGWCYFRLVTLARYDMPVWLDGRCFLDHQGNHHWYPIYAWRREMSRAPIRHAGLLACLIALPHVFVGCVALFLGCLLVCLIYVFVRMVAHHVGFVWFGFVYSC